VFQLARDGDGRSRSSLIEAALEAARDHLDMDVSLLSEFQAGRQVYRHVAEDAGGPFHFAPDDGVDLETTFCQRVINGALPSVIPNASELDETIGAYVGVPVHMKDGRLYGSLCCISREPDPTLRERDARFLAVLAAVIGDELSRHEADRIRLARITSRIEAAMLRDELTPVFQPIVALASGRVAGLEALSRFRPDPRLSPQQAFAEAWEVGLGIELELHAVRVALARLAEIPEPLYLSVNASPDTVASPDFEAALRHSQPHRIVVEVTEHAVATHYDVLAEAMGRVRALGVRFAVDDVGAGYAGLNHLVRVAPDVIKLDRFLISGVDQDPARQALAGAAAEFAGRARIRLVAEGIETPEEHEQLLRLGIRYGQGYHYARPGKLESVL
jgi:EAL domain-containing protein (putative c-di-GMP-specific phosphodiesterase class I)